MSYFQVLCFPSLTMPARRQHYGSCHAALQFIAKVLRRKLHMASHVGFRRARDVPRKRIVTEPTL